MPSSSPASQTVYNRSAGSTLGTLGSSWEEDPAPLPVAEAEGQAGALPCSIMDPADWGPECLAESAAIALGGGTVAGMLGIGGAHLHKQGNWVGVARLSGAGFSYWVLLWQSCRVLSLGCTHLPQPCPCAPTPQPLLPLPRCARRRHDCGASHAG